VGEASDHLQLIKFLAVLRPRERGLQRGENFWLRVTTASAQCLCLSERFFSLVISVITLSAGLLLHYRSKSYYIIGHRYINVDYLIRPTLSVLTAVVGVFVQR